MTTNAERAEILVRALEAGITANSTAVVELFTDDVRGWAPAMSVTSAAELAVEIEDRDEAFSEIELEASPLDVSGNRACVEWVVKLTHSGRLELGDDETIEPTGLRVTLHGTTIAEFDGDKIRSFRQYWDEVELLEQLALLPDD